MAIIECTECGAKISNKAECCPKCGCPSKYFYLSEETTNREFGVKEADDIEEKIEETSISKTTTLSSETNVEKNPQKGLGGCSMFLILCVIFIIIPFAIGIIIYGDDAGVISNVEIVDQFMGCESDNGQAVLSDDLENVKNDLNMFGFEGHLTLSSVTTDDAIDTVEFFPNKVLDENEYNNVFEQLKELYGENFNIRNDYGFNSYSWKNVDQYSIVALHKYPTEEGWKAYVSFQNTDDLTENTDEEDAKTIEQDKFGYEQMVGYDSLIKLPEDSPVIVSGIAEEISEGIYLMDIFNADPGDVTADNINQQESILIFDLEVKESYDNCYIKVEGYTNGMSEGYPVVIIENVEDQSDTYLQSGGTL